MHEIKFHHTLKPPRIPITLPWHAVHFTRVLCFSLFGLDLTSTKQYISWFLCFFPRIVNPKPERMVISLSQHYYWETFCPPLIPVLCHSRLAHLPVLLNTIWVWLGKKYLSKPNTEANFFSSVPLSNLLGATQCADNM